MFHRKLLIQHNFTDTLEFPILDIRRKVGAECFPAIYLHTKRHLGLKATLVHIQLRTGDAY